MQRKTFIRTLLAAAAAGVLPLAANAQATKLTPERKKEISESIPLARLGRAEDVAGACVFLGSELSAYCTGITLDVNGGMLIH